MRYAAAPIIKSVMCFVTSGYDLSLKEFQIRSGRLLSRVVASSIHQQGFLIVL